MKKPFYLIALLFTAMFYFSGAVASQDGQDGQQTVEPSGDEIVAICEDKFSAENYTDEEERNGLIDKCINDSIDGSRPAVDEG